MTGVLEEAFLLNLRPAMYYVRARRNGLLRYARYSWVIFGFPVDRLDDDPLHHCRPFFS